MNEEFLEELYEYSLKELSIKLERKRHLETKALSVLQATAILISLFLGFDSKLINSFSGVKLGKLIILKIIFYMTVAITLVLLLLALNDKVANLFGKNRNKQLKDLPSSEEILDDYSEDDVKSFQEKMIRNISDTIKCVDNIIYIKNLLFNFALNSFIFQ